MYLFLVNGSWPVMAVSQEWAMSFYKVVHGEGASVASCEWVQA